MATPNRAYCIGVSSQHKHFMTQFDSKNAVEIIKIDVPNFQFCATEVDVLNKVELQERVFNFKPGTTLYLVASREMIGWYYIIMSTTQGMGCTCKQVNCSHLEALRQYQNEVAAKPVIEPVVEPEPVAAAVVEQVEEVTPRNTTEYWLEIVKKGRERDRAFLDGYWREAKLLQLQAQQEVRQQHGL